MLARYSSDVDRWVAMSYRWFECVAVFHEFEHSLEGAAGGVLEEGLAGSRVQRAILDRRLTGQVFGPVDGRLHPVDGEKRRQVGSVRTATKAGK